MTQEPYATADTQAAEIAQLGAIIGPVIPYVIYRLRRERDPFGAREAARATNFGVLVLAAFAVATLVRALVPFVGFLGTVGQLAIVASSVVLCLQAFSAVRRGVSASYPIDIKVVKT
jgi:uncharacterized Tic20 family protein